METSQSVNGSSGPTNKVVYFAIQLLALAILLVWCFRIVEPFITPIVWGGVLAIALFPLHKSLTKRLKNRSNWSAGIITVLMLAVLIGPAVWLMLSTVNEFKELSQAYQAGEYAIPLPPENVKTWPLIGNKVSAIWTQASTNLTGLVQEHSAQVKAVAVGLMNLLASTGKGIILFTLSIVVGGVLLAYASSASGFAHSLFVKLLGKQGESMTEVAEVTVRNVAKGILGVALIQSIMAGIGFVVAGIPFAGVWILVCLILAIVQVGILPVSIGVIIYIWGAADTGTATLFTIWMLFVGVMDNILKPIMLGKGAPAPMLVVFVGSIGGFMMSGFIGLFTGAIILTLGYKLFVSWLKE